MEKTLEENDIFDETEEFEMYEKKKFFLDIN